MYATKEYVDRVEERLRMRENMIKEDLGAISETVVELLEGQQRLETHAQRMETHARYTDLNLRAIMDHLGVPAVELPEVADS